MNHGRPGGESQVEPIGVTLSTIVLVHGIAQEQLSADSLEAEWLPALAGGVRTAGHHELADRLWRDSRPSGVTTRMAYYGDRFTDPDAQGSGGRALDDTALDLAALDLAERLSVEWLRTAAEYAADPRDRAEATRRLLNIDGAGEGAQGPAAALRPALNALARLRWFAPFGLGLAGKFVWRAVSQVSSYLTEETVRQCAQDRVLEHVDADTRLVIGHSLGSVVAYEALHRTTGPVSFLTLGSPLGLRSIVYDRLRPAPPRVPDAVSAWTNVVDRDDLVAAHLDLEPYFPPARDSRVVPHTLPFVDNGSAPHSAVNYLTKAAVGRAVAAALS